MPQATNAKGSWSIDRAELLAAAEASVKDIVVASDAETARLAQAARIGALTAMRELRRSGIVAA